MERLDNYPVRIGLEISKMSKMVFGITKDDSIIHKEIVKDIFQSMMSLMVTISISDSSLGTGRRFVVIWGVASWPQCTVTEANNADKRCCFCNWKIRNGIVDSEKIDEIKRQILIVFQKRRKLEHLLMRRQNVNNEQLSVCCKVLEQCAVHYI